MYRLLLDQDKLKGDLDKWALDLLRSDSIIFRPVTDEVSRMSVSTVDTHSSSVELGDPASVQDDAVRTAPVCGGGRRRLRGALVNCRVGAVDIDHRISRHLWGSRPLRRGEFETGFQGDPVEPARGEHGGVHRVSNVLRFHRHERRVSSDLRVEYRPARADSWVTGSSPIGSIKA